MEVDSTSLANTIVCCVCGISIEPNPSYRCLPCLRLEHDISEDIPKEVTIFFCRGCERYLEPPSQWIVAQLESKELLSLCLKKLRGLDKVRLVDATFLYTEPNSRRLKLKVVVQKEVDAGTVLQQSFEVEYTIGHQFCSDCHRLEAKDTWKASLQIRQKVDHKRTFYYLEQLMLRHNIARLCTDIKPVINGIDLFFHNEREARKVVEFISSSVISKSNHSKKLVSHDMKSNIYNYKFTYCVEIPPICKDSIVCLPARLARTFGGISPVCLVKRVAKQIVLMDPNTAQTAEVNTLAYYKAPFVELMTSKHLTKFIVMEMEDTDVQYFAGQGHISHKHIVCDVWVQRESDIGTDKQTFCRTHLGNVLSIGDTVLGYDLSNANLNNSEVERLREHQLPDVLLIKKYFGDKSLRNRKRKWRLRSMGLEDKNSQNRDYVDFMEELEEDEVMRQQVNIYLKQGASTSHENTAANKQVEEEQLEADVPTIPLEEMLDELTLNVVAEATGRGAREEEEEEEKWEDARDVVMHE